ncbi:hypothetical protein [Thermaurantiacus sp.]
MKADATIEAAARSRFLLTFTNGWKPGVAATETVDGAESLAAILAGRRWCWVPDESSDCALAADLDMLIDHVSAGDPAWLMEPTSGDMVHIQPIDKGIQ